MKNLVIVESPAKANTIGKYLGSDYTVKSSIGHIRGLPSKSGSIDVANDFTPKYAVDADKKKIISELKKAVKEAQNVLLASDEDREGEAIAWHLAEVLKLNPKTTGRIVFHEITKSALDEALRNPRTINQALVEAQQARQSLDYLVGFELSPVLWRKVRPKLSAGRVQSVAVRLVVEREAEITSHQPEHTFKLTAEFILADGTMLPAASETVFRSAEDVRRVLNDFSRAHFTIKSVTKKPGTRNPSLPFTTSTLQQEASNRLSYSPRQTMQLAQRLYEAGHITYMRTDSLNLSDQALGAMAAYINGTYGQQYYQRRTFKSKDKNAQEAHEAIRPTDVRRDRAGADEQQQKLYGLIWRRTVASQMAPATLERTVITINASTSDTTLDAKGETVTFDGFLKVYGKNKDDVLLPTVHNGDSLTLNTAQAVENLSRGPARYTEASLVRKLEEMGIGRPSTYASIINTIQARDYTVRGDIEGESREIARLVLSGGVISENFESIQYGKDTNKLFPTDTGKVVTDFLVKYFPLVMDYGFTRAVESKLDDIAAGNSERVAVLREFYTPFHDLIEKSGGISRAEASQARHIGDDPKSGRPIYARYGRFGPMLQKGEQSDDPKPEFAPLPEGTSIESVNLDQALIMFTLPRLIGKTEDEQEIKANIGRFGPYIQIGKLFVSIKPLDPHSITLEEARRLYKEKLASEQEKNIADLGSGIRVLNGRFGAYITDGKRNGKIPKGSDPKSIDLEQAKKILDEAPKKKFKRPVRRRSTS